MIKTHKPEKGSHGKIIHADGRKQAKKYLKRIV